MSFVQVREWGMEAALGNKRKEREGASRLQSSYYALLRFTPKGTP